MSLSINVTSAPAGPDDPLVFEILASGSIDGVTAQVTDPGGTVHSVYDNGDVDGYTSESEAITGGLRITVYRLFGWWLGELSVEVNAGASGPSETLLHDSGVLSAEHEVFTNLLTGPAYEYTGADFASYGTGTLRIAATMDVHCVGSFGSNVMDILVSDPGQASSGDFIGGTGSIAMATLATFIGSLTYVSKDLGHSDFTGPGSAKSVYVYPPATFAAGFAETDAKFKNLQILIYSEGGGTESATETESFTVAAPSGALVTQARSRVILQYQNSPKLLKEIELHAMIGQQVMDFFATLPPLDDPANASGVNLDVDGEIVGQGRLLSDGTIATDGQYRVLIAMKGARNVARVSSADYLAGLVALFGAPVRLADHGGMAISYVVMREPTADEVSVLDADIVPRPMGVKVTRAWAPAIYFGFAEDPGASGFDVGHLVEGF